MPDTSHLYRSHYSRQRSYDSAGRDVSHHGDLRDHERHYGGDRNRAIDERRRYETHGHAYDDARRRQEQGHAYHAYDEARRFSDRRDSASSGRGPSRYDDARRYSDDRRYPSQTQGRDRDYDRSRYHDDASHGSADWRGAPAPYDARRWEGNHRPNGESQYREAVDRFIGEGGDSGRYAPRGHLDREDDRNSRSNWDEDEGRGSSASRRRAAEYDDEDRHPGGRNDDYPDDRGDYRHASRSGSRQVDSRYLDFGAGR